MTRKLTTDKIQAQLTRVESWIVPDEDLHKEFRFSSFTEAFGSMVQPVLVAESMNHHSQWFNVYNRVVIDLTAYDDGGISDLDFELASRADDLARY